MTWRRLLDRFGPNGKVRFARLRAALWGLLGIASVPLGWANSVALVWAASVYANVASEVASAEASDESAILNRLDAIEAKLDQLLAGVDEGVPEDREHGTADHTEDDHRDESLDVQQRTLA